MIASAIQQLPRRSPESQNTQSQAARVIVHCALCRLESHPCFHGRSNAFGLEYSRGNILISGQVPSFYLKQQLQEALRDIDGVEMIDNRVNVICPVGLSSTEQQ
jgi:hypothetical protein